MKKTFAVALVLAATMVLSMGAEARTYYGGGRHTSSHGGYYAGGTGSSHKGGHYQNYRTGNHYGRHR
jgi:hypothetical protein